MSSYEYQKLRGLKRKLELINMRGGACEICGYNKNIAAFDFHHRDPKEKSFELDMRRLSNSTMEQILTEFSKCDLICSNCHREIHSTNLEIDLVKELVKNIDNNILEIKKIGKPKCIDCGDEINYTYKRCRICSNLNKRKVNRPSTETLKYEFDTMGAEWCANKYNVTSKTIRLWNKA